MHFWSNFMKKYFIKITALSLIAYLSLWENFD